MKPELRLALLIPFMSLLIINTAFAEKTVHGYKEELDDGSEVLRIPTKEKVLTIKIDKSGRFQLDPSVLEGVYDQQTGQFLEPALPVTIDLFDPVEESVSPAMMPAQFMNAFSHPALVATPGKLTESTQLFRKVIVVPSEYLPPLELDALADTAHSPGDPLVPLVHERMGTAELGDNPFLSEGTEATALTMRQSGHQQSSMRETPVVTQKEVDMMHEAVLILQQTEQQRKLALPYEDESVVNASSKVPTIVEKKSESGLQLAFADQQVDSCSTVSQENLSDLETQIEKDRADAGYADMEKPEFDMSVNVVYDPALEGLPKVNPKKIKDEISGLIVRFSEDPEQRALFAQLLTYANDNELGIAIYHPEVSVDIARYNGMILLDARLPVGQAAVDAVAKFLANVAIMKIKQESPKYYRNVQTLTHNFLRIASMLLKEDAIQLQELTAESKLDQVIEGLMVFLQYKEMNNAISGMATFYAQHSHSDLWWLLTTMEKLYLAEPVHFAVSSASKQLLRIPVMGTPLDLYGTTASKNMQDSSEDESDVEEQEADEDLDTRPVMKRNRRPRR